MPQLAFLGKIRATPIGVGTIRKPDFRGEEMGRIGEITDKRARRYIRITDELKWEYIDRLMQLDKYKKSFNKVINDALDYGLPLLLKSEFGEIEDEETTEEIHKQAEPQRVIERVADESLVEITDLLEEIVMNTKLSKSMIASLFNERAKNLYGYSVRPELFDMGYLQDTPMYLSESEQTALDNIKKSRRKRR